MAWDIFKAYTRWQYKTNIAKILKARRAALTRAETESGLQEASFVTTRDPQDYVKLQSLTGEVLRIRTSLTQKLLAQS